MSEWGSMTFWCIKYFRSNQLKEKISYLLECVLEAALAESRLRRPLDRCGRRLHLAPAKRQKVRKSSVGWRGAGRKLNWAREMRCRCYSQEAFPDSAAAPNTSQVLPQQLKN